MLLGINNTNAKDAGYLIRCCSFIQVKLVCVRINTHLNILFIRETNQLAKCAYKRIGLKLYLLKLQFDWWCEMGRHPLRGLPPDFHGLLNCRNPEFNHDRVCVTIDDLNNK